MYLNIGMKIEYCQETGFVRQKCAETFPGIQTYAWGMFYSYTNN